MKVIVDKTYTVELTEEEATDIETIVRSALTGHVLVPTSLLKLVAALRDVRSVNGKKKYYCTMLYCTRTDLNSFGRCPEHALIPRDDFGG